MSKDICDSSVKSPFRYISRMIGLSCMPHSSHPANPETAYGRGKAGNSATLLVGIQDSRLNARAFPEADIQDQAVLLLSRVASRIGVSQAHPSKRSRMDYSPPMARSFHISKLALIHV